MSISDRQFQSKIDKIIQEATKQSANTTNGTQQHQQQQHSTGHLDSKLQPQGTENEHASSSQKQAADKLKDFGNRFFEKGLYEKAVQKYTQAIAKLDSDPIYYSNRAQAYINLKQYRLGLKDTETAIQLSPNHYKSYIRKGQALAGLNCFEEAFQNYRHQINTHNKQETDQMKKMAALMEQAIQQRQSGKYDMCVLFTNSVIQHKQDLTMVAEYCREGVGLHSEQNELQHFARNNTSNFIKKGELIMVCKPLVTSEHFAQTEENWSDKIDQDLLDKMGAMEGLPENNTFVQNMEILTQRAKGNASSPQNKSISDFAREMFNRKPNAETLQKVEDLATQFEFCFAKNTKPQSKFSVEDKKQVLQKFSVSVQQIPNSYTEQITQARAIYTQMVFFKHSCYPNTAMYFIGDLCFIRALQDIKENEIITRSYVPEDCFPQERVILLEKLGIQCNCAICEVERRIDSSKLEGMLESVSALFERLKKRANEIEKADNSEKDKILDIFSEIRGKLGEFDAMQHQLAIKDINGLFYVGRTYSHFQNIATLMSKFDPTLFDCIAEKIIKHFRGEPLVMFLHYRFQKCGMLHGHFAEWQRAWEEVYGGTGTDGLFFKLVHKINIK